jgi:hypothetical protein
LLKIDEILTELAELNCKINNRQAYEFAEGPSVQNYDSVSKVTKADF